MLDEMLNWFAPAFIFIYISKCARATLKKVLNNGGLRLKLILISRNLNRGCLVYMFSLLFSASKFLINLQGHFRKCNFFFLYVKFFVHKFFRDLKSFHFVFKITTLKVRKLCPRLLFHQNLLINRLLRHVFVLLNAIVFNRSNGLIIECFIAFLMN